MDALSHVGIRELRENLASLIRRADTGERIVVTVDGTPRAVLGPIDVTGTPSLESLFASGLALPPRASRPAAPTDPAPLAADIRLGATLDAIRGGS